MKVLVYGEERECDRIRRILEGRHAVEHVQPDGCAKLVCSMPDAFVLCTEDFQAHENVLAEVHDRFSTCRIVLWIMGGAVQRISIAKKYGADEIFADAIPDAEILLYFEQIETHIERIGHANAADEGGRLERLFGCKRDRAGENAHMILVDCDRRAMARQFAEGLLRELSNWEDCEVFDWDNCFGLFVRARARVNISVLGLVNARYEKENMQEKGVRVAFCSASYFDESLYKCCDYCRKMLAFQEFNGLAALLFFLGYFDMQKASDTFVMEDYFNGSELCSILFKKHNQLAKEYVIKGFDAINRLTMMLNDASFKMALLHELWHFEKMVAAYQLETMNSPVKETSFEREIEIILHTATKSQLLATTSKYLCRRIDDLDADAMPKYITKAKLYIIENYASNIKLRDIADSVFLNMWYLSSQFKHHTGQTIKGFMNSVRIESAKRILMHEDVKILEVCERTGFHDCAYFISVFKKSEGLTPTQYKKWYGLYCKTDNNESDS